jgi:hypothetical protein
VPDHHTDLNHLDHHMTSISLLLTEIRDEVLKLPDTVQKKRLLEVIEEGDCLCAEALVTIEAAARRTKEIVGN